MRELLRDALDEPTLGTTMYDLLDFWHVVEKVAPAAQVLHGELRVPDVLRQWRLGRLNRTAAVDDILTAWRDSAETCCADRSHATGA